jgi:DNA-binding response OmpR family regulator
MTESGSDRASRVLVVDDDDGVRVGVAHTLRAVGYEAIEAVDAAAALQAVSSNGFDLAVIDIGLPGGLDGLGLARRLQHDTDTAVIFLTIAHELEWRLAAFDESGADDYVTKPFEMAELLARVRAVLRRAGRPGEACWQVGVLTVDAEAGRAEVDGVQVELTATELRLLCELARNQGRVLSKEQLIARVWQGPYDGAVVERHVSTLRGKLAECGFDGIETLRGLGYRLGVS